MENLQTEDGQLFIRSLASFIRQHEKALANSLQLSVSKKPPSINASAGSLSSTPPSGPQPSSTGSSLAAAFSFAGLNFMSHSIKPAHLTLTPHHLYYLLSRMEVMDIVIGPMNVRLEDIHSDPSPANYVSFLQSHKSRRIHGDTESIHSVSSVRSVMSGMSTFWSSIGLGSNSSKSDKARAAVEADLKYLYSAFTKLPSLRFAPDHRSRLIKGYEEFPFDTAVPLFAFKNLQQLEIIDLDFRQFHGWDRLADQLCLLTVKRAKLDDLADLITNIVLDDAEKRRKRSNKGAQSSPTLSWALPLTPRGEYRRANSDLDFPIDTSPKNDTTAGDEPRKDKNDMAIVGSASPERPMPSRPASSYRYVRTYSKVKRSGSGGSVSSDYSLLPYRSESVSNLLGMNVLHPSKWQRLKYLSLADNALTDLSSKSILPLAGSLRSLNLSSNLFAEIPDSLASLTRLTSLDLSNCMIESLQSLLRNPLPAILTLKLKSNRLHSLAGIERLISLENLSVQDNRITDAMEAARLTSMPNFRRLFVKQNPFATRMQDYRITIFNLFRKTPGYVEDITIDDRSPSHYERKFLVERVPETEHPTTILPAGKALKIVQDSDPQLKTESKAHGSEDSQRRNSVESEIAGRSSNPRKGFRRRIIDLAKDGNAAANPAKGITEIDLPQDKSKSVNQPSTSIASDIPEHPPVQDLGHLSPGPRTNLHAEQNSGVTGADYRARIEALRQEFGSNWISALGEQSWEKVEEQTSLGAIDDRPPLHRASSHAIATGASGI